jgi:hypothetical protein
MARLEGVPMNDIVKPMAIHQEFFCQWESISNQFLEVV